MHLSRKNDIDRECNLTKSIDHPNVIKMFSKFKHIVIWIWYHIAEVSKDDEKFSPQ